MPALCPYCQTELQPDALECLSCRLTYPRTSALLGALPRLQPVLSDSSHLLSSSAHNPIRRRIANLHRRFPQITVQIVIHAFPPAHPFCLHVFWLFNAAAFSGEARRGKNNHAILIAIDPERLEAAIMPGYGLEPLLPSGALDHLLERAAVDLESKKWADAILQMLDDLDQLLESIALPEESPSGGEF